MKPCVTVCLVPEARRGPFVYWGDLGAACENAVALGFAAVEIFAPAPAALDESRLRNLLDRCGLKLAALGTGAGWILHGWHLTHPQAGVREQAQRYLSEWAAWGARFGAPVIIGSMQGRAEDGVGEAQAGFWLREGLECVGAAAAKAGGSLLLEPLNRYETNLIQRLEQGLQLVRSLATDRIRLLADLFHMNIEEASIPEALRAAGPWVGHIHFVDSNRRAAGWGHLDFPSVAKTLHQIGYQGYLSAEALPEPDSEAAARQTMRTFAECL